MRRCSFLLFAALCVLTPASFLVAQSPPPTPFRGLIDHVTAEPSGWTNASGDIWHNAISGDGRYVVFTSAANLAANDDDYNGWDDIFVRDRMTGITTRVSKPAEGGPGDGISGYGTISANGRYAAFASGSSNLVAGDTNNHWDVFVRDLDQQTTVRVSVATDGSEGDQDSYYPSLSADGRFVAFISWATTLGAPGVTSSSIRQIYLHDRDADGNGIFDEPGTATTEPISIGLDGAIADHTVDTPHVSSDGRYVLFESEATNLDAGGNLNGMTHLYRRDRQTGQTEMIDRAMTGGPSSWGIYYGTSDMSDDGRYITFSSISPDIVWFDMNWTSHAFLYDAVAGPTGTQIVSRLPDGTLANQSSYATSVSGDGRYVVFTTAASNLASPPATSGPAMLVARDMVDGSFTRVDVIDNGDGFDEADYYITPSISADGTAIVLSSRANNPLINGYSGYQPHVFVLTALTVSPGAASFPMSGGSGTIEVDTSAVSGWDAATYDSWIVIEGSPAPYPVHFAGPGPVHYEVADNPSGITRNGSIRIGSKTIVIHQEGDGDATPPILTPTVTGTEVNGWYTSDITVTWSVTDPESEIVSQYGCYSNTYTTDFLYAQPFCEATSHGGTSSMNFSLRRDTTGPAITIPPLGAQVFTPGSFALPSFSCSDPYSGTATCELTEGSVPLDTTPGWHTFTVSATDHAGNASTKSATYLVGTGVCVAPNDGLRAHWRFDSSLLDVSQQNYADPTPYFAPSFTAGVAGLGWWKNPSPTNSYLTVYDGNRTYQGDEYTVALWLKPWSVVGESGTIIAREPQYRIARYPDGTLRWAFNHTTGFNWVNTGIVLPVNVWAHVAVTYDHGLVNTYINGQLAHTHQLTGTRIDGASNGPTIGGRPEVTALWVGGMDELEIYQSALSATEVEALALAGSGSTCLPAQTSVSVSVPSTVPFGPTYSATVTLQDQSGNPMADRLMWLYSLVGPGPGMSSLTSCTTDSNGQCTAALNIPATADPRTYSYGVKARFDGDAHYLASEAVADVTLVRGTPQLTWPAPSAIVYGAALGATQLNATANAAGTFAYSPALGTVLDAGTQTLSVTFTPADTTRWNAATSSTTLVVNKAIPTLTATGGQFTYDAQPHAGSGAAAGVFGETLSPVEIVYDGASSTPPTDAGAHTVRASYAGSANYLAGQSADATLTINRATPTVDISTAPVFYNGQERRATISIRGIAGELLNPRQERYDGSPTPPTNAGTYALEVQYPGSTNYIPVTVNGSFVIRKAFPLFPTLNNLTFTYDGQPHPGYNLPVRGVFLESLTPLTTTYNGSTTPPVTVGVYTSVLRYDGSANYEADSRTYTLTINVGTPSVAWEPDSLTYGQGLGAAQLDATANVPGTFVYYPPAGTILNAGPQFLVVTFTPDDSVNYRTTSVGRDITVFRAHPQLTWAPPAAIVFGTPLSATQLNATANTTGTFVYNYQAGAVLSAGQWTLSVTFTPEYWANYYTETRTVPLTVVKATPVVSWTPPADIVYGTALSAAQLNATANVPGTFAYSPAAGTVLNAGSHTLSVTFTPTNGANYNSASASVPLTVAKATPAITWSNPANIIYGTSLSGSQLNATAAVPGTLSYSPAAGAVLNAGTQTLSVTFTPTFPANYNVASASVSLTVDKAASTISWSNPANIVYGTALSGSQLNATANVPGTFSYSPASGTVLSVGAQTLSVTFTPEDAANYNGASANVALTVTKAASTINWSNPANIVYGTALGGSQLNATANVPGTFSYSPASGTVLNAGAHSLSVTFTPDDASNYNGGSASVSLAVTKAASTINWPNPANIVYGTPLDAAQLNATANVPGTFSYSPAAGTILGAGAQTLSVAFTPADAANYNGASANASLTVTRAASTINWSNPAGIVYGTALGGSQLTATASVAGTFSYSPAAGTVLGAGTQTLSVTFTPTDSSNYAPATANVSVAVAKASPVITWANPAGITYGTALSGTQLNATADVSGSFAYSPAAGTVLNAGTQQLSVTFTPADAANYTPAAASAAISIAPRALTVQTDSATKVYGAALPAFTASGAGFVNGDSMASLSGTLTFSTSATATSAPGSYAVTPGGVSSANYSITFANGTLTVTAAATTLTLTTTPNPSNNNQQVQLRAVVAAVAPGAGTATGTVEFRENGTLLGTATLVNGVATMTKNFKRGTHPLTATYAGNSNFNGSSGNVTHQTQ